MALYIKKDGAWLEWHLGQKVPVLPNVIELQADGDELEVIIEALKKGTKS